MSEPKVTDTDVGIVPPRGAALASTPGMIGWLLLVGCFAAAALGVIQHPYYSAWIQAAQKLLWSVALGYGLWRYRPQHWQPWACVLGAFSVTALRNLWRLAVALDQGQWVFQAGRWQEVAANVLASLFLVAASLLVMRGRRPSGDWWALADAWVIGIGVLLLGIRLATLPIYLADGPGWGFFNLGVVLVGRAALILVPLLAVMMSERVRGVSFHLYFYGILLSIASEYGLMASLGGSDVYNHARAVAMLGFGLGQAMMAAAALLPSMRGIISPLRHPRPPWNLLRTGGMLLVVLVPVVVIALAEPLGAPYDQWMVLSIGVLLAMLVIRLRVAVLAASRSQMEIRHLAHHDELTGLPNRRYLNTEMATQVMKRLERGQALALACCYIDLDDLKSVNDRDGHHAGDAMIRDVGRALGALPSGYAAIRVGGDEFLVLAEVPVADAAAAASAFADGVFDTVGVVMGGLDGAGVRASVGLAWMRFDAEAGSSAEQLQQLLDRADLAQTEAKRGGGAQVVVYRESMSEQARRRISIERELPHAWQMRQMQLAYQPVVRLDNGEVYGAEALLRWNHPQLGMVPPQECIGAAERNDLIVELGERLLESGLREVAMLGGASAVRIGVNLSGRQLQPAAIDRITEKIAASGLARRLWLEITEQQLVEERKHAARALLELRSIGVQIVIDDFGTGFCGLDYLCTLPVDIIKFDGVFAREAIRSASHRRVVQYGVQLAQSLGAVALAEGVEDMSVARLMRELGCVYAQGYGFGRPAPSLWEAVAMARVAVDA